MQEAKIYHSRFIVLLFFIQINEFKVILMFGFYIFNFSTKSSQQKWNLLLSKCSFCILSVWGESILVSTGAWKKEQVVNCFMNDLESIKNQFSYKSTNYPLHIVQCRARCNMIKLPPGQTEIDQPRSISSIILSVTWLTSALPFGTPKRKSITSYTIENTRAFALLVKERQMAEFDSASWITFCPWSLILYSS